VESGSRKGAVVAGADAISVERRGAISHGGCPFTDYKPFIAVLAVGGDVVADELSVLVWLHSSEVIVEDLIFVVVHDDVLGVVVRGGEEAVPGRGGVEAVVEDDGGVADFSDVVEAVAVVLCGCTTPARDVGEEGLVQEFDGDDYVLIGGHGVFGRNLSDNIVGEGGGVTGSPFGSAGPLTGVVEAVLGERCSWKQNISWML